MQKKSLKSCSTAKNVQKITKIQRHAQKWYADTNEHDDNKYNTILNHGWTWYEPRKTNNHKSHTCLPVPRVRLNCL